LTSHNQSSNNYCHSSRYTKQHPLNGSSSPNASIFATRAGRRARCRSRLHRPKHTTLYIRRSNGVLYIACRSLVLCQRVRSVRTTFSESVFYLSPCKGGGLRSIDNTRHASLAMCGNHTIEPNRISIIYRNREDICILTRRGRDVSAEESSAVCRWRARGGEITLRDGM
jgi:hypothetical protein